jgi:hypothetical protein
VNDIADLYRGRLDDFIARRDILAKAARSSGDRAGADRIKAIRKPSRTAWALNIATSSDQYSQLVEAVTSMVSAQSRGGDVRSAMTALRESVRAFAAHAADCARADGQKLDRNALTNCVFAVIADPTAFDLLQRGLLCDVPEAGGLDVLANITLPPVLTVSSGTKHRPSQESVPVTKSARARRNDEALAHAEAQLAERRKETDQSLRSLNTAASDLSKAELALEKASAAVEAARAARDRAQAATEEASQRMGDAEAHLASLRKPARE